MRRTTRRAGRTERFWRSLDVRSWVSGIQDPSIPAPDSTRARRVCITTSEVEEFRKNGVVLLRGVLNDWVPYLREVTEHQMAHPQVSAFLTGLRTFFSMDYVQAGLFLTNNRYLDFWMSSPVAELVADLKQAQEVRLIVDQLNVNPHCPMFTDPEKFHTDVGVISAVAEPTDVVRAWIPLQKPRQGLGTLEFQLPHERVCFDTVEAGDLALFTPTIPHRVIFPPDGVYSQDRCVVIASLHASRGGLHPVAVPEFPRIFPEPDLAESEVRAAQRLYPTLDRYFRLWGKPSTLLDEWMQFITYEQKR